MLTLVAVLIAIAPFAVVGLLLVRTAQRENLRQDVRARQIALTDAVHARLGAVVAPVVRRLRRGWQVRIAVPLECAAMTQALLAIAREAFAPRDRDPRSLEIVLTRQPYPPQQSRRGTAGWGREGSEALRA